MNVVTRSLTATLVLALTSYLSLPAMAGDGKDDGGKSCNNCCSRCGLFSDCCKVCRLVKTEKELRVDCWASECEDFCVPGPSTRGCKHCEPACTDCKGKGNGKDGAECDSCDGKGTKGSKGNCRECGYIGDGLGKRKFIWHDWVPGCARLHTKKKLLRKTATKVVPAYEWVMEDICGKCDSKVKGADIKAGEQDLVPEPPQVDEAQLRYGNPHNVPVNFETAEPQTQESNDVAKVFAGVLR